MRRYKRMDLLVILAMIGGGALYGGTEGDTRFNTYYGTNAGVSLDDSAYTNAFFGVQAGNATTSGSGNAFFGYSSGYKNTTAEYNTFIGFESGYNNTTGERNTYIGYSSGYSSTTAEENTFVGAYSGGLITSGSYNTFIGRLSGAKTEDGRYNTFLGHKSGHDNESGDYNTYLGVESGEHNGASATANTFVGRMSGRYSDVNGSIFIGNAAGYHATRSNTLYIDNSDTDAPLIYGEFDTNIVKINGDFNVTDNVSISGDVAVDGSLQSDSAVVVGSLNSGSATVHGDFNTTGDATVSGILNSGSATVHGDFNTTGDATVSGTLSSGPVLVDGDLNTTGPVTAHFAGSVADSALKMMDIGVNNGDASQKSDVGFQMSNLRENFAWVFRTWEPDRGFAIAKYGNGAKKEFRLHDTDPSDPKTVVLTLANGAWCDGVWHNASSRTFKKDIEALSEKEALEAFEKLQPVTYVYKSRPDDPHVGFIAEDLPDLVADPGRKSVSTMDVVALLTKVVQSQKRELEAKDRELKAMKREIGELQEMRREFSSLKKLLRTLQPLSQTENGDQNARR